MSAYPETLLAHMAREVTTLCHCWRLTRADGQVSGYTDHDRALTVGGTLFAPETGFSASEARDTLGLGRRYGGCRGRAVVRQHQRCRHRRRAL